jgi:hypothetical protein
MSIRSFLSQVMPDRFFEKNEVDFDEDGKPVYRPSVIEALAFFLIGAVTARWLWEYPRLAHGLFRLFH